MDLLNAIQEEPLATLDWLAKRTKTSKPTIAKRLAYLEGSRPQKVYMQDPEHGRIYTVVPLLNYHNLGFEYFNVIVETASLKQTKKLEKLIPYHPYIRHRSRCYGSANGILFQFRSPDGTRAKLLEFLDKTVELDFITNYRILASDQNTPVYTTLKAEGWDPASLTWDFDWDEWFTREGTKNTIKKPDNPSGTALSWLAKKDIYLINEVMKSARRKNKEILSSLQKQGIEFTPQTFSRRYATIKEECFLKYRTMVDPSIFDVYNTVIITGEASKNYLSKLTARLMSHPIPFGSTFRTAGNELFWFIRLQGSHLSKLISRISSDLHKLDIYLVDYSESARYLLEPEAYDENEHKWIQDEQFMIHDVLRKKSK